jgi:ribose transport system permease protein
MKNTKNIIKKFNRELATLCVLGLIIIIFSILAPRYLEIGNLADIVDQATINGLLAFGMTFVVITGGIDLSVGATMAVVIVICGELAVKGVPGIAVAIFGIISGALLGVLNGSIITKLKLQPFIATLGMCSVLRGLAYLISGGWPVMNIPESFRSLFQMPLGRNFRISMVLLLIAAIACEFILKKTRTGVYAYAIGSNEEATKLSGVNTNKFKMRAYIICGITAALAGMVMLTRLGSGEPTAGEGYELNAIAAAAIGGASLAGGKGSILGTVLGALVLSALKNGLVVIGMNTFYQYIATGLIIIIAAYFEVIQGKVSDLFGRIKNTSAKVA